MTRLPLSDRAQWRLLHYCRRAAAAPPDHVFRPNVMGVRGRHVRHVNAELRQLVWADVEVRDALLEDGRYGELVAVLERHRCPHALGLLDLMAGVTLEAGRRAEVAA